MLPGMDVSPSKLSFPQSWRGWCVGWEWGLCRLVWGSQGGQRGAVLSPSSFVPPLYPARPGPWKIPVQEGPSLVLEIDQTPRPGVGVQGGFSETDLIPPGHTPQGLRPGAGGLCVCGRGHVLTTPNTCGYRPHPFMFGQFPDVCLEPGFFLGRLNPLPSHPRWGCPRPPQCHCLQL